MYRLKTLSGNVHRLTFVFVRLESGGVWQSDATASHAGARAESTAVRDAPQRLSEEASSGSHRPARC